MSQFIPPLTWFRAFESSARHLSFTKAAHELNLTQSAISQHVRALEGQLGSTLFIRKPRGLALTDHGRRLLPSVSTAISALASAAATFSTTTEKKMLTVAASHSLSRWYIVPNLATFQVRHPNLVVKLTTKTWPDEFSGLDVDVEIRFDSAQSAGANATLLKPNDMQIVAAPSFKFEPYSINQFPNLIAQQPLIQVLGTADTWQNWAESQNLQVDLNITTYVESHGIAVEMARTGLGIAYTNSIIAAPSVRNGSLLVLGQPPARPKEGYYLTIHNSENRSAGRIFANWVSDLIADQTNLDD